MAEPQRARPVAIIGAMEEELRHILALLDDAETLDAPPRRVWRGRLAGRAVVLAHSDVGKVNAALTAQMLIERHGACALLNFGSSGAIAPGLDIGDLVLATEAVQHDVDLRAFGLARGEVMFDAHIDAGGMRCRRQAAFATDAGLRGIFVETFRAAAEAAPLQPVAGRAPQLHAGRILSSDAFIGDGATGRALHEEFGALCVDMEAAAIAQVAAENAVPVFILRAISDRADGGSTVDFPAFLAAVTRNYAQLAGNAIARLSFS